MKIGDLAKKTGCKVVTIRFYELKGLLTAPGRTRGNYRSYGQEDQERLEFIRHCRKHGISLGEIKKLLLFRDQPQSDCSWVGALIDSHIDKVKARIKSLEHLKRHLEQLRQRCAGDGDGGSCGIMQGLDNQESCCASCAKCAGSPETLPGL